MRQHRVRALPQIVHSPLDGGPYISAGIFIAKHPDTGVYIASWNRSQIVAGDHLRVRRPAPQHLGQYHEIAERQGKGVPAACIIGAQPSLMFAASSKAPIESDELLVAGRLAGRAAARGARGRGDGDRGRDRALRARGGRPVRRIMDATWMSAGTTCSRSPQSPGGVTRCST